MKQHEFIKGNFYILKKRFGVTVVKAKCVDVTALTIALKFEGSDVISRYEIDYLDYKIIEAL